MVEVSIADRGADRPGGGGGGTEDPAALAAHAEALTGRLARARAAVGRVILGQEEVVERALVTLLAGGLQADRTVGAGQRDDVAALDHRLPAILLQLAQQRADARGFVVGRRVMVAQRIDELLMLGAYPPAIAGFFAAREAGDQLVARFDDGALGSARGLGAHEPRLTRARALTP